MAGKGGGAGLLKDIPKMLEIIKAVVAAVKVPVTVKTRLGWDEQNKIITTLAEQIQDCGHTGIDHTRANTRKMYTGEADWTLIGEVKQPENNYSNHRKRRRYHPGKSKRVL